MKVKGAILCGGKGKRLRPLTYYFQKTMIPVGRKQKPLLEYIIKLLRYYGIRDIVLLVGYKHEQIVNYFEDGLRFGVKIEYVQDPENPRGTGGALINAYKQGFFENTETVLVYYGDILSNINISEMLKQHWMREADVTLAVASKYQIPVGVVKLDSNGRVVEVVEKPWLNIYATIGILTLQTSVLKFFENVEGEFDIMANMIPELLKKGAKVYAYRFHGEWYDVGSTERYEKLDHNKVDELFKNIVQE